MQRGQEGLRYCLYVSTANLINFEWASEWYPGGGEQPARGANQRDRRRAISPARLAQQSASHKGQGGAFENSRPSSRLSRSMLQLGGYAMVNVNVLYSK